MRLPKAHSRQQYTPKKHRKKHNGSIAGQQNEENPIVRFSFADLQPTGEICRLGRDQYYFYRY
jgi:hypothetical protein